MADLLQRIAAERARRSGNPSMPDYSPQAQTAHAARLVGVDPVQGQATPGGETAYPGQSARMAAIQRRRAELQGEMARGKADYEAETANRWQFADTGETPQPHMGGPPAQQTPQRQTDPAMPPARTSYDMDWSYLPRAGEWAAEQGGRLADYMGETIGNIPESAERTATGIWDAVSNPMQTAEGLGKLAVGTGQKINEAVGLPESMRIPGSDLGFGDQRQTADAAGQALADRYGGWDELGRTFRDDPAGFGLDLAGAAAGPAGVARMAGRSAPSGPPRPRPESRSDFIQNAPSGEQLRTQADALYRQARESGGTIGTPIQWRKALVTMKRRLREGGVDEILHPKANRMLGIIEDMDAGIPPDFQSLDILRRQFGAAASDIDRDTARLGSIGMEVIDDFMDRADAPVGKTAKAARATWHQLRKSEMLQNAVAKADSRQSGKDTALRQEFGKIYRAAVDKKKWARGFNKDEIAAIKRVSEGDLTNNVLRRVAALGFGTDGQRSMLTALAGIAAGGAVGGGFGSVVAPIVGTAAGRAARHRTSKMADFARATAASGRAPRR